MLDVGFASRLASTIAQENKIEKTDILDVDHSCLEGSSRCVLTQAKSPLWPDHKEKWTREQPSSSSVDPSAAGVDPNSSND